MNEQHSAVTLFYSYAHEDEPLRDALNKHLSGLQRHGLIQAWHDRQIPAGADRAQDIDRHLESASIILLLISADFVASDYCYGIEMQRALQRHDEGSARVIPILLRPCEWEHTTFAILQALPRNGKAVTQWPSRDEAFREIARDIREVIIAPSVPMAPGEPRPPLRTFLSAAPADHTFATRLTADLRERRVNAWYAERSGDLEAVRTQIRSAGIVLQIISPAAQSSRVIREQLDIAHLYQRPLISIVAEGDDSFLQAEHPGYPVIDAREGRYQQGLADLLAILQPVGEELVPSRQEPPTPAPVGEGLVLSRSQQEPRNPYKGLDAFTAASSGDFFGRDKLIAELIEKVGIVADIPKGVAARFIAPTRSHDTLETAGAELLPHREVAARFIALTGSHYPPGSRLLAIVGASGSGKSSVVMAGVLPRLQQGALLGSEHWVYLPPMKPGARPLEALAFTLADHLPGSSFKRLREDLEDDSTRGLHLLALQIVRTRETLDPSQTRGPSVTRDKSGSYELGDTPPRVVLFIDQFEELFTLTSDEWERRQFIDLLITAIIDPKGSLVVILTLRADFYDRLGTYPELGQLVVGHQAIIWPMNVQDLRAVITRPAALPDVQLSFEGDLVGDLLFEMQGQPGALPLLQFTLAQLFARRDGYRLTQAAYQEIGGVRGALSQHAEQTYAALPSEEHRKLARTLFVRLIEPGATEQDTTRRRASLSEFTLDDPTETRLMRETIDVFVTARLLTANEIAGKTTIEASHEALIREWPRLGEWMRTAREDIPLQQAISGDVAEWERRDKPGDRLYRGSQLKEAQAWATRNTPSAQERAFLRASVARRWRTIASVLAAILLILASLGTATWFVTHQQPDPTLVTNLRDDDSVGSLRWAIEQAPAGRTITFDPNVRGAIVLSRNLVIGKDLLIKGPGKDLLIIRGSSNGQIVNVAGSVTVTISGLAFQGDEKGCPKNDSLCQGLIYNEGTLILMNSTVSGNTAREGGGIYNLGLLTVTNSTISGNTASYGGGIYNLGPLMVTNSTISGNTAQYYGGGIDTTGTLTVTNSTISGNTASQEGGGILSESNMLTITNSTIADNKATKGGGMAIEGLVNLFPSHVQATLTFCTVSGNSASSSADIGIFNQDFQRNPTPQQVSSVTIQNSIVAGPSSPDIAGRLTSKGHNLFLANSGATFDPRTQAQHATDKTVTVQDLSKVFVTTPAQLGKNGGPTMTLKLLSDPANPMVNPAVDKIPLDACQVDDGTGHKITMDQRGMPRPDDGESMCDIGAYES